MGMLGKGGRGYTQKKRGVIEKSLTVLQKGGGGYALRREWKGVREMFDQMEKDIEANGGRKVYGEEGTKEFVGRSVKGRGSG